MAKGKQSRKHKAKKPGIRRPIGGSGARGPELRRSRPGLIAPLAAEAALANLTRLTRSREFEDIEEMNAFLQQAIRNGQPPAALPTTPLERAQDLAYKAWEAEGERRLELARQALALSPDCADAHVILALAAATPREARPLFEQALAAGERALGPRAMAEDAGRFWGLIETRPYMRARFGLARCLEQMGEREAAVAHYRELLRLNPGDNQGVRYFLFHALLRLNRDAEAARLLSRHAGERCCEWTYGRVLLAWRERGDGPRTRNALARALRSNPWVPDFLLGRRPLPDPLPDSVGFGDEDEAAWYAAEAGDLWRDTPGLAAWLAASVPGGPRSPAGAGAAEQLAAAFQTPAGTFEDDGEEEDPDRDAAVRKRVLADHPEFRVLMSRRRTLGGQEFTVGGHNPFLHVQMHQVIENQLAAGNPPEAVEALQALCKAGAGRHEACHILAGIMIQEMYPVLKGQAPFDVQAYRSRLRYAARLAEHLLSAGAWPPQPRANSPCPCGSGRPARRCCADRWPPLPVQPPVVDPAAPPEWRRARPGMTLVLGSGRYASPGLLERLPQDHPLVYLENAVAVARALAEAGDDRGALCVHRDMVARVEKLTAAGGGPWPRMDAGTLANALQDLLHFCLGAPGFEAEGIAAAERLARLYETGDLAAKDGAAEQVAFYRMNIADLHEQKGSPAEAEAIYRELLSRQAGNPCVHLRWGQFLEQRERWEEAEAAYRTAAGMDHESAHRRRHPDDRLVAHEARLALEELRRRRRA